jgi:hypothetical protein
MFVAPLAAQQVRRIGVSRGSEANGSHAAGGTKGSINGEITTPGFVRFSHANTYVAAARPFQRIDGLAQRNSEPLFLPPTASYEFKRKPVR